jgi:hypothetical protein
MWIHPFGVLGLIRGHFDDLLNPPWGTDSVIDGFKVTIPTGGLVLRAL